MLGCASSFYPLNVIYDKIYIVCFSHLNVKILFLNFRVKLNSKN